MEPVPTSLLKKPRELLVYLGVRLLIVSIPVIVGGYFSYEKAKLDTAAGYKALAVAVSQMQPAVEKLSAEVNELRGEVEMLQKFASEEHVKSWRDAQATDLRMAVRAYAGPKFKQLPPSLDAALKVFAK